MPYTTSGSPGIWTNWVTTSSTTSTASSIWYRWITSDSTSTTSYTVINNGIWTHWNEAPARPYVPPRPALIRSAAEQAEIERLTEARLAESRRQQEDYRRRSEAAKERAKMLLLEHLTPDQQRTFVEHGWFMVRGGKTGKTYRIKALDHLVANVDLIENGKVVTRLCAHADTHQCPLGDHLLYQKLMIELAEPDFIKTANLHEPLRNDNDNSPRPLSTRLSKKQVFPELYAA